MTDNQCLTGSVLSQHPHWDMAKMPHLLVAVEVIFAQA